MTLHERLADEPHPGIVRVYTGGTAETAGLESMIEARAQLVEKLSSPPPVFRQYMPHLSGVRVGVVSAPVEAPIPQAREFLEFLRNSREKLSMLDSETDSERESSREMAATLWGWACLYYDMSEKTAQFQDPEARDLAAITEEIAVELEDMAESQALAGSEAFAQAVQEELKEYVPAKELGVGA